MASTSTNIWTKKLNKLPKFSILQIANYISVHGKDRAFDKGYNFFTESYIHDAFVGIVNGEFNVKAKCWKSQKKNEKPHELSVKIKLKESTVIGGRCSCIAGSSGVCNHVIALLYLIHHWSSTKQTEIPADLSSTSLAQKWHVPRGDKIEPEPVMKLSFAKATTDRQTRKREPVVCYLYDARAKRIRHIPTEEHITCVTNKIGQRNNTIPMVYLCKDRTYSMTDTLFGDIPVGSPLSYQLTDYHSSSLEFSAFIPNIVQTILKESLPYPDLPIPQQTLKVNFTQDLFDKDTLGFIETLEVSSTRAIEIEQTTLDQGKTQSWHNLRYNRLTASNFGDVMNRKSKPSEAFLKNLFSSKDLSKVASVAHGTEKEDVARKAYTRKMSKSAKHETTVFRTGLLINPCCSYLGASPDGKVIDKSSCDHFGLLEIKCPYKYRNNTPTEAAENTDFCLEKVNGQLHLRKTHNYYYQITGQMAIAGIKWCDFVVTLLYLQTKGCL